MKLYKFRSLANENDLNWIMDILETGKFWHSKFSDFNDPREGGFTLPPNINIIDPEMADQIYNEKRQYKICSFSNKNAFKNPIMWGYYANGFKGIVIEIEVEENSVGKVEYVKDLFQANNFKAEEDQTKKILTRKFKPWKHEGEYRSLIKSYIDENKYIVGKIKTVFIGYPYAYADNREDIYNTSSILREYDVNVKKMISFIKNTNYKYKIVTVKKDNVIVPDKSEQERLFSTL